MKPAYDKPPELYDGLRLHSNENTGGCSPRVTEALAKLTPEQLGFYPPYAAASAQCAAYFGVDEDRILLTNGLDEGIMALAVTSLQPSVGGPVLEAIVPEPAFEIFRFDTAVAGGRLVQVMPRRDFSFPLDEVLAAVTPATRLVFLTNPNNPTGMSMPMDAIRAIARAVPREAIVFVDEAYAEFAGRTFIPELEAFPGVVVGRTFSKAFGLAGIRIGCLLGAPATLERIRVAVPVYSVNIAAVVAVQAALGDRGHMEGYLRQVAESKALLYAACDRMGVAHWKSDANFVLLCVGDRTGELVAAASAQGVYIRNRSSEPGCAGCLRVSTGMVEHTCRFIDIMEGVLCAAR
jgi:histidinol-phosphate aminotransferase